MLPLPTRSTRTYTLLPCTTLILSQHIHPIARQGRCRGPQPCGSHSARRGDAAGKLRADEPRDRRARQCGNDAYAQQRDGGAVRPEPRSCPDPRSEEHTSELQSLMRSSYAVFCLKKKNKNNPL